MIMKVRKYTVITQLHEKQNTELLEYLDSCFAVYNRAKRDIFYKIKHDTQYNKAKQNTYLQTKYGILKRTANSIIINAQGNLNALIELKQYEKKQLEYKIATLKQNIEELEEKVKYNKELLKTSIDHVSLKQHRNYKRKLVVKKDKLNRYTQKLSNLKYQIENNSYKICFGTKHLLKTNYTKFVDQRDSQILYVGSKTETACNQLLQLSYNDRNNQFIIKLRKDIGGYKNEKGVYCYGKVYFNNYKNEIKTILENNNSPLTYKIIKKKNRYYLYCTFEIQRQENEFLTSKESGVIGLDFNKGFITLTETNQFGHMIDSELIKYRYKQGNSTQTDLERIVCKIIKRALKNGKDVVIENLNFKKTKAKTISKKSKKYNEMLHTLAYRKFMSIVENVSYRNKVWLHKVNPAWTSWIADKKYCNKMKLNGHVGASFVIARRGQGYIDRVEQ